MELFAVFLSIPMAVYTLSVFQSFLLLGGLFLLAVLCSDDNDNFIPVYGLTLVILAGLYGWLFFTPIFTFINSGAFFPFMVEYLAIGFAYMFFRWWVYVKEKGRYIAENKDELIRRYKDYDYDGTFGEWLDLMGHNITVTRNKYRLTNWLLMWPFSAARWLLTDFVKWIANTIYDVFGNVFNTIKDRVWASFGLDSDLMNFKSEKKKD